MSRYDFRKQPSVLIQGAMEIETNYLIEQLEEAERVMVGNWTFYTGFLGCHREPVIISRTYQGMVNAASATSLALTYFSPKAVINQGIAGGHGTDIYVGDMVIGTRIIPMGAVMQDVMAEGEGVNPLRFEPLELEIFDKKLGHTHKVFEFPCDERLIEMATKVETEKTVHLGTLGSADEWNNQVDWIAVMRERYQTAAEDMESAAMAQICRSYGVPFIGIRIISNSIVTAGTFDESVALDGQKFVKSYIEKFYEFEK